MAFKEKRNLMDNDSSVRIDVESMARIEINDIEYLLHQVKIVEDLQLQRILYESIISKVATAYQLALKACKYLQQNEKMKEINNKYPKDSRNGVGYISKLRGNLFHDGVSFIDKNTYYPFGVISGRGFIAIKIKKGATFEIKDIYTFNSNENEFVITSEGIFEIYNSGEINETWKELNVFPSMTTCNYNDLEKNIKVALEELKTIWYDLSKIRKEGQDGYEYQYLNECGKLELIEKKDGKLNIYNMQNKSLEINGNLKCTPVSSMRIEKNKIIYE